MFGDTYSHVILKHLTRVYNDLSPSSFSNSGSSYVSRDALGEFLNSVQGETCTYTEPEFLGFWLKTYGLGAIQTSESERKDLNWPLPNYFISSSHKTYLARHQHEYRIFPGAYRTLLRGGCRCIEINVWNGGAVTPAAHGQPLPYPTDEPIVTDDLGPKYPCGFREVCQAIGENTFETNDLAVIVSLEVHADIEQQNVMVKIMKEEWGETLLDKPIEGIDPRFSLPTLGDVKRRIMVERTNPPKNTKVTIAEALSDLAIYTFSELFKGFDTPAAQQPGHIFSISEGRGLELATTHAREMFTHNKRHFMRAFPNGTWVDSSNPDPRRFWRKGVQMVALKWRNLDECIMFHEAIADGRTGTEADAAPRRSLELAVTILAGQHICAPDLYHKYHQKNKGLRFFVRCQLHVDTSLAGGRAANGAAFKLDTALSSDETGRMG
ncbi:PLC-like phosphodiesterase [Colletotrichum falcatum]|nr:PLC-like phosphodiesterase [Colletotrichum falcatum]